MYRILETAPEVKNSHGQEENFFSIHLFSPPSKKVRHLWPDAKHMR
jgi:hypothetical protein